MKTLGFALALFSVASATEFGYQPAYGHAPAPAYGYAPPAYGYQPAPAYGYAAPAYGHAAPAYGHVPHYGGYPQPVQQYH